MKIAVKKQRGPDLVKLIKRCGYIEIKDRQTGETSFVHRVGPYFYPRFHLYIEKESPEEIILNLHLDQKRPSYSGCSAHSADYGGEVVEKEAEGIKKIFQTYNKN